MTTLLELAARLQAAGAIETMLLVIVKATLILAIARLLLMGMPRASAATKHMVATAALVAVAAMPVMTVIVPAWHIAVEQKAAAPAPVANAIEDPAAAPAARRTVGATDAEENESAVGTAISLVQATGVVPDEPLSAMSRAMNVTQSTWKGMLALAVIGVTLLMLFQMALGMAGVWHVSKNAEELTQDAALIELDDARDALQLNRDVKLLRSSRISVPVLWGFFKPVLLLPAEVVTWPTERLRVVLLHELAHLKRFDGISLILTRLAVAIFWYHPLAWSLERAGRSECERACDDLVLTNSATKPSEYADHLLAIARSMPTFDPFRSVTLAMSRKSQLEGRLLSILQPHVARRVFSGRGVAVACALAVAVIIPVSALRLTAEQPQPTEVAKLNENQQKTTDAQMTVTPDGVEKDVEAIENYFLAKLGKYNKHADKWMREPKTGADWYERAYDLYRNDRYEDAAAAFVRAAELNHKDDTSLYNAACSWALLGDARRATEMLARAIDAGWDDFEHIAEDSDFDPIRSDAGFQRLVQRGGTDVAMRRMNDTMARYRALEQGVAGGRKDKKGLEQAIEDGIEDAIGHWTKGKHKIDTDWHDVGLDLLRLRQFDQAINAFQNAINKGEKTGTAMYNLACAYSLKGDVRSGMEWLDKAIENGFSGEEKMMNDPDIANLRKQPGFEALVRKSEDLEMKGCCDDRWDDDDNRAQWRRNAEHHRAIANKYPQSGRAWFNLGFTALQARDFRTGQDAFQRAIDLNYRVGTSSYNIACGYALQGNRDAAFQWLDKAKAHNFELQNYLFNDEDLESLHDDPRFKALAEEVDANGFRWKWKSEKNRKKNS
jgi:beta-lactamase regulating signal transducer with metallopeptidase domain/tetratricopeptide (TPR) repeat protein